MGGLLDAPAVPDVPVGLQGPLGIECIGRGPIMHSPLNRLERTQTPLGAGSGRHWLAGGHQWFSLNPDQRLYFHYPSLPLTHCMYWLS